MRTEDGSRGEPPEDSSTSSIPSGATPVEQVFGSGHEQVVFCADPATGLRAIIAIYSTALGPALGGTRFYPYPDEAARWPTYWR